MGGFHHKCSPFGWGKTLELWDLKNYYPATCPTPFCFYTKQFKLKMKIVCFTADVCLWMGSPVVRVSCFRANDDKKGKQSNDGQTLRVKQK
jgi:hypothetical protein